MYTLLCDMLKKCKKMLKKILSYGFVFFLSYMIAFVVYDITAEKRVHIFMDCATGPILLQSTRIMQLPKTEPKLVAWGTFTKPLHFNAKKYSIKFLSKNETNLTPYEIEKNVYKIIIKLVKEVPDIQLVIHTNIFHSRTFLQNLHNIPKKNIKMIHLYEDGVGNVAASRQEALRQLTLDRANPPKDRWNLSWPYFLHLNYPVTYHLAFWEDIQNDFPEMAALLKGATISEINFNKIKQMLSSNDKKNLAALYNIDKSIFKNVFINTPHEKTKKSVLLLGSRPIGLSAKELSKELSVYEDAIQKGDYIYIFKPHPNAGGLKISRALQKKFKDLIVLNNQIPTEIFFLLDIGPDYIAGFSSSVFLSLPEYPFLFYIQRKEDVYLPFLLKKGIIHPDQVINRHLQ